MFPPGKTFSRPLTVVLASAVLAPSWYFGHRPITTVLSKMFATAPLPDFPTRAPSLSPAQQVVQTAQSLWSGTQKVMAAVGAFLGIGGVALLVKDGNAKIKYGGYEIPNTIEEIEDIDLALLSNRVADTSARAGSGAIPPSPQDGVLGIPARVKKLFTSPPPPKFPDGISTQVVSADISQFAGNAIVINVFKDLISNPNTADRENFQPEGATGAVYNGIRDIFLAKIQETGFTGKSGTWLLLDRNSLDDAQKQQWDQHIRAPYIICVGLGKRGLWKAIDAAGIRKAGETTAKAINDFNAQRDRWHVDPIKSFGTIVHGAGLGEFSVEESARLLKEGLVEEMAGRDKKGKGRAVLDISIVENDENKLQDICKGFISFKAR